jgi:integrase
MGSVFLRGESWVIEYKVPNGKIKRETIGKTGIATKAMAKQILQEKERQVKLGQYDMLEAVSPTFDEISAEYLHHQEYVKQITSHSRSAQAVSHFLKLFGAKRLNEISASDIDIFKQRRLDDGVKLNTIVRDLVVIRHLFNYAYSRKKFFGRNPVSESGLPQVNDIKERVLSISEQEELLKHCSPELADIIMLALNTGMRRDEVLFLEWVWIDLKEGYINLPHTHSKSKKSRKVPINSVIRKILLERKLQSDGAEYVFHISDTRSGARTWLQRAFRYACKQAGIEGLRFHDLRHTAATRLVEANIPLPAVAELLGHSSIRMTERYSHPQESVIKGSEILASFS